MLVVSFQAGRKWIIRKIPCSTGRVDSPTGMKALQNCVLYCEQSMFEIWPIVCGGYH